MKQNSTIGRLAIVLVAMFMSTALTAQTTKTKTTDSDLIGVWVMESMQYEGQKKTECGGDYNQVKVYRASGEYACAEVAVDGNDVIVFPHEYGTYTFKNGKYTECGRNGTLVMNDNTHFEGQWRNRHDKWRKVTDIPAKLVDYIVERCRQQNTPKDIQPLIRKYILSKPGK